MRTITKIVVITAMAGIGISTMSAGERTGEEIFKASCTACHATTHPKDESKMIAPPIMGAVNHVKIKYEDRNAAVKFIADYILNPTKEKSTWEYGAVKEFGLMPSQKSTVSEEDSLKVAEYVYDNFGRGGYGGRGYGRGRGQYDSLGRGRHRGQGYKNFGRDHRGRGQGMHRGRGHRMGHGMGRGKGYGMGRRGDMDGN